MSEVVTPKDTTAALEYVRETARKIEEPLNKKENPMAHHGDEPFPAELLEQLGATGQYPQGKLNADDEGEIALAVGADSKQKKVIIQFGKPVSWIGMDPAQASAFAASIRAMADRLEQPPTEGDSNG